MTPWLRLATCWLCLAVAGLGGALAPVLVVCTTARGQAAIEWGCDRDMGGGCAAASKGGAPGHCGHSQSCEDEPLTLHSMSVPVERSAHMTAGLPPVLPVIFDAGWRATGPVRTPLHRAAAARAPNSLAALRCVMLNV